MSRRACTDCRNRCCRIRKSAYARPCVSCCTRSPEHPELREGLARGYVYLAQFVDDADADVIARGAAVASGIGDDAADAEPAMRLINRIKAEMELALDELAGNA